MRSTRRIVYRLDLISATDGAALQRYFLYDGLGSTAVALCAADGTCRSLVGELGEEILEGVKEIGDVFGITSLFSSGKKAKGQDKAQLLQSIKSIGARYEKHCTRKWYPGLHNDIRRLNHEIGEKLKRLGPGGKYALEADLYLNELYERCEPPQPPASAPVLAGEKRPFYQ